MLDQVQDYPEVAPQQRNAEETEETTHTIRMATHTLSGVSPTTSCMPLSNQCLEKLPQDTPHIQQT